jgi:hypothetical protein
VDEKVYPRELRALLLYRLWFVLGLPFVETGPNRRAGRSYRICNLPTPDTVGSVAPPKPFRDPQSRDARTAPISPVGRVLASIRWV